MTEVTSTSMVQSSPPSVYSQGHKDYVRSLRSLCALGNRIDVFIAKGSSCVAARRMARKPRLVDRL